MQVALTDWNGRISPLFDTTRMLLVANVSGQNVIEKRLINFEDVLPIDRVAKLNELGINVLICGGISDFFVNLIEAQGIQIISFKIGVVDQVLETYLSENQLGGLNDAIKQNKASKISFENGF